MRKIPNLIFMNLFIHPGIQIIVAFADMMENKIRSFIRK